MADQNIGGIRPDDPTTDERKPGAFAGVKLNDMAEIANEMQRLRNVVVSQQGVIKFAVQRLGGVDLKKMRARAKHRVTEAYRQLLPYSAARPLVPGGEVNVEDIGDGSPSERGKGRKRDRRVRRRG